MTEKKLKQICYEFESFDDKPDPSDPDKILKSGTEKILESVKKIKKGQKMMKDAKDRLIKTALETVNNPQMLNELSGHIARLALPDSARQIAQEVIELAETANK